MMSETEAEVVVMIFYGLGIMTGFCVGATYEVIKSAFRDKDRP